MKSLNRKIVNTNKKIAKIIPKTNKVMTKVNKMSDSIYRTLIKVSVPKKKSLITVKYDSCKDRSLNRAYNAIKKQVQKSKPRKNKDKKYLISSLALQL